MIILLTDILQKTNVSPSAIRKIDEQQIADRCVDAEMRQRVCVYE